MTVRRILVVELLGGFGDLLIALPAVHALAASHPGARLTVVTFEPGHDLLRHDPHVHEIVPVSDHTPGAPEAAVTAVLERGDWDLAVTTTTYGGIAEACRAGAVRAVTDLWAGAPDGDLVGRRFLRLLAGAGAVARERVDTPMAVHVTAAEREAGHRVLAGAAAGSGAAVVLVPGAGMAVKRWSAGRWWELAAELTGRGTPVVTVADEAGVSSAGPVGRLPVLPALDLRGLASAFAALAERGGVVVGGDTGPVRLAAAAGAATVTLFGPTSAGRYGMGGMGGMAARDLQGLPGCAVRRPSSITEQECWWSGCPFGDHPMCMTDVTVPYVAAAVADLLAVRPG